MYVCAAFLLDDVIANLRDDPTYYQTRPLVFSVLFKSDLFRLLVDMDSKSVRYHHTQRFALYHTSHDEICNGLARLRLDSEVDMDSKSVRYHHTQRDTFYHTSHDGVCNGLAHLRLDSDNTLPVRHTTQYADMPRPRGYGKRTCKATRARERLVCCRS